MSILTINRKVNYALMAMLELGMFGLNYPDTCYPAKRLSEQINVPLKFLEHILSILKQSNLVKSSRGANGGYQLSQSSEKISVNDIINAVDAVITYDDSALRFTALNDYWDMVAAQIKPLLMTPLSELILKTYKKENVINYAI